MIKDIYAYIRKLFNFFFPYSILTSPNAERYYIVHNYTSYNLKNFENLSVSSNNILNI
jgi:hypothetical protein